MIDFAALVPHPPIIIPEIGGKETEKVEKTIKAMKELAQSLAKHDPATLIVITPHGPLHPGKMNLAGATKLRGDLNDFGSDLSFEFHNNLPLAEKIIDQAQTEGIAATFHRLEDGYSILDHGILVPLYFLLEELGEVKILPISFSHQNRSTHFAFGEVIDQVCQREKEPIALIASGDLSHRLTLQAPAGFSKVGREFDQMLLTYLKEGDLSSLIKIDPEIVEQAGECGYRSLLILLGAISKRDWQAKVLSYQGPFGVGYGVVEFKLE